MTAQSLPNTHNIFQNFPEQTESNSNQNQPGNLSELAKAMANAGKPEGMMREESLSPEALEAQKKAAHANRVQAEQALFDNEKRAREQAVVERIDQIRQQLQVLAKQANKDTSEKLAFTKNYHPGTGAQEETILSKAISAAQYDVRRTDSWQQIQSTKKARKNGVSTKDVHDNMHHEVAMTKQGA